MLPSSSASYKNWPLVGVARYAQRDFYEVRNSFYYSLLFVYCTDYC